MIQREDASWIPIESSQGQAGRVSSLRAESPVPLQSLVVSGGDSIAACQGKGSGTENVEEAELKTSEEVFLDLTEIAGSWEASFSA
jgi:hypothetical protein